MRSLPRYLSAVTRDVTDTKKTHQRLSTDQFTFGNGLFSAELSDLRINITALITLRNPKTGGECAFQYSGPEYHAEEIVGYRYHGNLGLSILIIND